jgi:hypothetical protein
MNCRECPCCIYVLELRDFNGRVHVLRCMHNVMVERAGSFPPILAEQPASCGPLPDLVESIAGCPKENT